MPNYIYSYKTPPVFNSLGVKIMKFKNMAQKFSMKLEQVALDVKNIFILTVPKRSSFNYKNTKEFYWGQVNTLGDLDFDSAERQLHYAAIT